MTRRDQIIKWIVYALGVLPIWILEAFVLNRLPLFGVIPVLLPLVAVVVGFWEGAVPGGIFGLCLGVIADAIYPGAPGGMTIGLTLMASCTGMVVQSGMRQNFFGYFLCAAGCMAALDTVRVLAGMVTGLGSFTALLPVAIKELLWSLVFTLIIYPLFKLIHRKVGLRPQ